MDNQIMAYTQDVASDLMSAESAVYSTLDTSTPEGKTALYNALTGQTLRLSDMVGKPLDLRDMVVEPTEVCRDDGSIASALRIILIATDGQAYACTSYGVYNALKRLIAVFGPGPWVDEPMRVEVRQMQRRGRDGQPRNILTLAKI